MELFHRAGLWGGMRIAHVMFAVMWMGLLWFFNFVQTPAYAEMEPGARNSAFDKLTWRALWWFRWAAMATIVSGLFILALGPSGTYGSSFWKSPSGMGIAAAILLALIMGYNVWMVIWPNQQIVIGNARKVLAGQEADPAAPTAARAARWPRGRTRSSRSACSSSWLAPITSGDSTATSRARLPRVSACSSTSSFLRSRWPSS